MPQLSLPWKQQIARLLRFYPLSQAMKLGISLLVPRHRIGINIVALDEADRVLLLKHVFHPYVPWGLPGGWLGRGETPQQCALRELHEETGLDAILGPLLVAGRKPDPWHMVMIYLGYIREAGPIILSGEILKADWFTLETLPNPLLPLTEEAIVEVYRLRSQGLLIDL